MLAVGAKGVKDFAVAVRLGRLNARLSWLQKFSQILCRLGRDGIAQLRPACLDLQLDRQPGLVIAGASVRSRGAAHAHAPDMKVTVQQQLERTRSN